MSDQQTQAASAETEAGSATPDKSAAGEPVTAAAGGETATLAAGQEETSPKPDAPKVDAVGTEAPKVEASKAEPPKKDAPKIDAVKPEAPRFPGNVTIMSPDDRLGANRREILLVGAHAVTSTRHANQDVLGIAQREREVERVAKERRHDHAGVRVTGLVGRLVAKAVRLPGVR